MTISKIRQNQRNLYKHNLYILLGCKNPKVIKVQNEDREFDYRRNFVLNFAQTIYRNRVFRIKICS